VASPKHGNAGLPRSSPRNQAGVGTISGGSSTDRTEYVNTGGTRRPKQETGRDWDWAEEAYARWRDDESDSEVDAIVDNLRDAPRVDGSRGFSREEILLAKNNVMRDIHKIDDRHEGGDDEYKRFDADPEIASAWIRMQRGETIDYDIMLLEHEIAEARHWQANPEANYSEAHKAANLVSNWEVHYKDLPFSPYDYRG
jgi:hypothetical protein